MKKLFYILIFFYSAFGFSQSSLIDKYLIKSSEIPRDYKVLKVLECQSVEAQLFYKDSDEYSVILPEIIDKQFQSFQYKKVKGSILYFEFKKNPGLQTYFAESIIWGDTKPSEKNPENIIWKENLMIVLSFPLNSEIAIKLNEIITNKLVE